jgi:hypothetical protein
MATAALVNHDIDIGRRIVAALTRARIPVAVYLWAFVPEVGEWQFVIATPLFDSKGPIAAYGEVQRALENEAAYRDVPLSRIFLKSPQDPVLKLLERESRAVPEEAFRVVNAPISGSFVEDAYLYTGFIHIIGSGKSTPPGYRVFYAPYSGRGSARPSVPFDSIDTLREFLEKKLNIRGESLDIALKELDQSGGASIPNVHLKPHDLKRLRLA